LVTESVELAVPDGAAEAWVSRPADGAPHPGVLLFVDAFGVRPQIRRMAERIAGWGYVVLVPNVFHREGSIEALAPTTDLRDPETRGEAIAAAMPRVRRLTADLAIGDVYVDALLGLPDVAAGPVAVTGYCMGARLAVRAACRRPDVVAACGGFHGGGLAGDDEDSPHLGLGRARACFFFGHADGDRSMPPEAIARLDRALDEAGLEYDSEVYPGAPHGYTMADTSSYDEVADELHFAALEDLLARTLGGPG
jgi:carboxymethylenebutenolidase